MKILLIGYGKMGKEIEAIALDRHHEIVGKIDDRNIAETEGLLQTCDVAIEFSTPHAVIGNIKKCHQANKPVVVGTTGWYSHFEEITALYQNNQSALFYATNFSVGVNLFFKMNEMMAQLMNKYPSYTVSIEEIHHVHKKDAPSGTAITAAERLIANLDNKTEWKLQELTELYVKPNCIYIDAIRTDEVPGTHTTRFSSEIDDLSLTHVAHSRKGFALGAVLAAEFIVDKKGVFTMKDLLGF